jgi:probable F420-dependent oxidoreductase
MRSRVKEGMVEFGVFIPQARVEGSYSRWLDLARQAEELGFDSVWVPDHVLSPAVVDSVYPHAKPNTRFTTQSNTEMPDPLLAMAILSAHTSRLRIGVGVLVVPYRPPLVLANQIATLDAMTGGRIELGVGVGWHIQEFEALGVPYAERGGRTDEAIEIWRALWTGRNAAYNGRFTSFPELKILPAPLQPGGPPIWVGGDSPGARRRAAHFGDVWYPAFASAERYREQSAAIREVAATHGRPAPRGAIQRPVSIVANGPVPSVDTSNPYYPTAGNPDAVIAQLKAFERAGVTAINVHLAGGPNPIDEAMPLFAKTVIPAFR